MGTTSIVISVVLYSVFVAKYTAVGSVRLRSVAMNISQRALPAHRKPSEDQQTACCFDCLETRGETEIDSPIIIVDCLQPLLRVNRSCSLLQCVVDNLHPCTTG